jgi:iron uptake system EfeUOB component EfeO/EfeM
MELVISSLIQNLGFGGGFLAITLFIANKMLDSREKKLQISVGAAKKDADKELKQQQEQLQIIANKNEEITKLQGKATEERIKKRDDQIEKLNQEIEKDRNAFTKHIARHENFEKGILNEVSKIYERLNPIAEAVAKVQGTLDAQTAIFSKLDNRLDKMWDNSILCEHERKERNRKDS